MQKYLKFDATFDRKPMQLLENWRDVVTAWCEGNYPGSDVLYSLELLQVLTQLFSHYAKVLVSFLDASAANTFYNKPQSTDRKPYSIQNQSVAAKPIGGTPSKVHPIDSLTPYQNR